MEGKTFITVKFRWWYKTLIDFMKLLIAMKLITKQAAEQLLNNNLIEGFKFKIGNGEWRTCSGDIRFK
jgi:hypothetical protein